MSNESARFFPKAPRFGYNPGRGFVMLLLLAGVLIFACLGLSAMGFPYDLSYGEAQIADLARRMLTGGPVYRPDLSTPPYVIDVYPPLYPLAEAALSAVTGLSLVHAGRVISVLAALCCAALIGGFGWRVTGRKEASVVALALFFSNPAVAAWAPLARIDLLGLALALSGLWLVYIRPRSWRWLLLAAGCLAAAGFARQSYVLAAPMAAVVWLWSKDRSRAYKFIVLFACAYLIPFAFLNVFTRGGFFLNTVTMNLVNSFRLSRAIGMVLLIMIPMIFSAALALMLAVSFVNRGHAAEPFQEDRADVKFIPWMLVPFGAGAIISAMTAGKIGSDVNYTLELLVALVLGSSMALVLLPERKRLSRPRVLTMLAAQVLLYALISFGIFPFIPTARWRELAAHDVLYQRVASAAQRGPVLADEYMGMVLAAGQPIYFQPFDYRQLYAAGRWDPAPFVAEIKAHTFPLIVIYAPDSRSMRERWAKPVLDAIEQYYYLSERIGKNVLYEPLAGPAPP